VAVVRMLLNRSAEVDDRAAVFDSALRAVPPIGSPTRKASHERVTEMLLDAGARLPPREE
jgi:hypothetical protein